MITQAQRNAYRYALEDRGVPDVIAFMAAQVADKPTEFNAGTTTAGELIYSGIWWRNTPQGYHFWDTVFLCTLGRK